MLIVVNGVAGGDMNTSSDSDWATAAYRKRYAHNNQDAQQGWHGWLKLVEENHVERGDCLVLSFRGRNGDLDGFEQVGEWMICDADHDGLFNYADNGDDEKKIVTWFHHS